LHTLLARQKKSELIIGFGGYLFKSNGIREQIKRESQGTKVLSISGKRLSGISVCFPKNKNEQAKIADCLASLDGLIAGEEQKLAGLRAHKKGLMQELFPAAGEVVGNGRFPEFQNAPPWQEKKFNDICKFVRGPFGGSLKKDMFVKDGYAVYEQSHAIHQNFDSFRYYITKEKFNQLKRFSVRPNDIIMSCSGTMGKFSIIPKHSKKGVINQALLKLTVNPELNINFVKTTMELPVNQEKLLSQSAGGAIKNVVSVSQIKQINLYIPNLAEQQKIADCLTSLDELITAQAQKIDQLKAHKKGLMQQLFPAAKGVS
jgi:type I restriction enzyme S subunit